uniref:uncharacterized protein LOC100176425 isoform X2 n=1 Tax=Ciona intestinalis TaxID=7719 RepID=UPI00089DC085|nr:uncharacterized protein LOC100176425 isoform X2 [Ciona intestinalis]|eukprot:XP_018669903.1 uncharacterized protein LOC100176425 isoform X2 [Ciona intestinalis]
MQRPWVYEFALLCCIILLRVGLTKSVKLPCQQRYSVATSGFATTFSTTTTQATTTTIHSQVTLAPSYVKANLCCGSRPFNSDVGVCCMGRVLRKSTRRCCLDGKHAPSESRCFCYPSSIWVTDEIDHLSGIEIQFTSLIEEMDATIEPLREQMVAAEEHIEFLDSKANSLYQEFLVHINMTRNRDPAEAEYITELISFLVANEANVENARKRLGALEKESMELLDAVVQSEEEEYSQTSSQTTRTTDVLTHSSLRRLRREIQTMNTTVETAEKLMDIVRQEIEQNLPVPEFNRQEAIRLTIERQNVLMNITRENRALSELRNRVQILTRIQNILRADRDLLVNLRQFLDSLLDLVLQMEAADREENQEFEEEVLRKRRKRAAGSIVDALDLLLNPDGNKIITSPLPDENILVPENGNHHNDVNQTSNPTSSSGETGIRTSTTARTTSSPPPAPPTARPCDFSPWERYTATFLQRANLVAIDLEELGAPSETAEGESTEGETMTASRSSRTENHYFATRSGTQVLPETETNSANSQSRSSRRRRDLSLHVPSRKLRLSLECSRQFRQGAFFWFREFRKYGLAKRDKKMFRRVLSTAAKHTSNLLCKNISY